LVLVHCYDSYGVFSDRIPNILQSTYDRFELESAPRWLSLPESIPPTSGFVYRFKSVEIKAQRAGSPVVRQARHVAQTPVLVYVFKRLPGPSARIAGSENAGVVPR
jgi:hypothetical protein